ncbi:hypothetical protein [Pseudomonas syringae]|uniref:hypothetical protein n=1 Tax=Pseudomonas syringae TaxID=317 RepID=UPI00128EA638|nr:hypothetical protein [Pseudomonas syringae]
MNIENNEASANIGDPLATVSRRFSVAPMMDWDRYLVKANIHWPKRSIDMDCSNFAATTFR